MGSKDQQRPLARVGAISGIDRALTELGVDPAPLLSAHGLTPELLAEGDRLMAFSQAASLLEQAARETGCRHFAAELAVRQDVNLLGAIGLLVQTAETVRGALQDVEQYLRTTHVSHIQWILLHRDGFDSFEMSVDIPSLTTEQARLVIELAVTQCYQIMRSISGGGLNFSAVCFRQGGDGDLKELRRFFQAPVQVSAEFDGLLFPAGAIDQRIDRADMPVHESVRRLILAQPHSLSVESLSDQVKVLIRPLLPTGQCSIERLARYFACDKRTLQRRLREESDVTYQQLLDEVRFETVCFYLRETTLPVTQLAQLAGFTEQTNFSRAFRRRFGQSPRQWRKTQSVSSND